MDEELDDAYARANRTVERMRIENRALALKTIVIGGGSLTAEQKTELEDLERQLREIDAAD
jgi:hypothetical protein